MKKFLTVIYTVGITLVLSIGALLLLTILPIPGANFDARVVQTGSMEPAIHTGSIVFIRSAENYTEDDIITYRRPGQETPTTHRVISSRVENGEMYFTTKGDANETQDIREVRENEVLGKVWFNIPLVGYLVDLARRPLGFFLLILIPALAIGGDEVRKIIKELKRMRKEKKNNEN